MAMTECRPRIEELQTKANPPSQASHAHAQPTPAKKSGYAGCMAVDQWHVFLNISLHQPGSLITQAQPQPGHVILYTSFSEILIML